MTQKEKIEGLKRRKEYWFRQLENIIEARKPTGNWMIQRGNQNAPRKAQEFIRKKKKQQQKCE